MTQTGIFHGQFQFTKIFQHLDFWSAFEMRTHTWGLAFDFQTHTELHAVVAMLLWVPKLANKAGSMLPT